MLLSSTLTELSKQISAKKQFVFWSLIIYSYSYKSFFPLQIATLTAQLNIQKANFSLHYHIVLFYLEL